jgi:mannosyltransferase OCH1-like enzyme
MMSRLRGRVALLFCIVASLIWWLVFQELVQIYQDVSGRQQVMEDVLFLAPTNDSNSSSSTTPRSSNNRDEDHDEVDDEDDDDDDEDGRHSSSQSLPPKVGDLVIVTNEDHDRDVVDDDEDGEEDVEKDGEKETKELSADADAAAAAAVAAETTTNDNKVRGNNRIPHRLVFTYRWNVLERQEPRHFYDNVQRTIAAYQTAWGVEDCQVDFLDDTACRAVIATTVPALLPYFDREEKGSFRSDICRVADLYAHGGYYFDVDMELIDQPFLLDDVDTKTNQGGIFGTAVEAGAGHFFQSFLVSTAGHPVLALAFDQIRQYYDNRSISRQYMHMGPYTLKAAYDEWRRGNGANNNNKENATTVVLLREVNLDDRSVLSYHPELPRRRGRGCCCNYVLLYNDVPYFYSRMVGAGFHCDFP